MAVLVHSIYICAKDFNKASHHVKGRPDASSDAQ
jgi:hypothetical protein